MPITDVDLLQKRLLYIQNLFCQYSTNKLDPQSFCKVLRQSGAFELQGEEQEIEKKAAEYFRMLDLDHSGSVSFYEFLLPLIPMLPENVAMCFTNDFSF